MMRMTSILPLLQSMAKKGVSAVLDEEVQNALAVLAKATAPEKADGEKEEDLKLKIFRRKRAERPHASRITKQDLANCKVCC